MATVGDNPAPLDVPSFVDQERSATTTGDVNLDPDQTAFLGMPPAEALPELSESAWKLLEDRVAAFEAAWASGRQPRIDDFLLKDDPTQGQLLIELVHTDLELRMKHGTRAEDYLKHFPELAARADVVAALRHVEYYFLKETARQFPRTDPAPPPLGKDHATVLPEVPGYRLLREIGRGGMGVVYAAADLSLGRTVAVKTLLPGASEEERVRLHREAEAAAGIQHPHVAQVFQILEQGEKLYLISELLPGGTLDDRMSGAPWAIDDAAILVESLARAVAEAHALGIVHRDLKPSNILFTADDVPKIADFGLVKRLDDASETTRSGVIAGSPSYMAPEQALGHPIGTGVDVWALGTILYELFTGRPPFRDATVLGTLELVRTAEPVAPRRLVHQLPVDLETICLRCLEKDPAKRYASAAELADDLERFLRGEAVKARPIGWFEHGWRWARKNREIAILAALLGVSLAIGAAASITFAIKEIAARRRAERLLFAVETRTAHSALAAGDPALAADLVAKYRHDDRPGDRFVLNYLDRLVRAPGRTIDHLSGPVYFVTFSPDETLLAACGKTGEIRLYDVGSWRPAGRIIAGQSELNSVDFSQDGKHLASAGDDGTVVLWDRKTHEELWRTKIFEKQAYEVEYVLDDKQLAVCGYDDTIMLLDAATGNLLGELQGHTDVVQTLAVTPDGRTLISTGDDCQVFNWDLAGRKEHWRYEMNENVHRSRALDLTRDGRRIVLGSVNSIVTILETDSRELLFQGGVNTSARLASDTSLSIHSLALVGPREEPVLLLGGGTVIETTLSQDDLIPMPGRSRSVWRIPRSQVRSVIEYQGGASLITASDDGFIDIWHRNQAPAWKNITINGVRDCDWIQRADGRNLLVVAAVAPEPTSESEQELESESEPEPKPDPGCWIVDPITGSRSRISATAYFSVRASPDGRYVVLGSESDGEIVAYDLSDTKPRFLWRRTSKEVFSETFAPDPRYRDIDSYISPLPQEGIEVYILAKSEHSIRLHSLTRRVVLSLDRRTGEILNRWKFEYSTIPPAISPDGRTLVLDSAESDELVFVNPADFSVRRTASGHQGGATAFEFSPDGEWLATSGDDKKIHLWRGDRPIHTWRAEAERIRTIEFSPDGALLAISSDNHPPGIWDVETRQLLLEPGRYPSPARVNEKWAPARFSVDGQWLAIAADSTVTFFDGRSFPNDIAASP